MDTLDRLSPTKRPEGSAVGYQGWYDLTFIHWRLPADLVRPLIPKGLTLDLRDGDAWVAFVPYEMQRVRPWWSPAVPGISWFCESNLRTYVHHDGDKPGVCFFSLEAASTIAVLLARSGWHLPYFRSTLSLKRNGQRIDYSGTRRWPRPVPASYSLTTTIGAPIDQTHLAPEIEPGQAAPGTLEHFLAERYYLYTADRQGRLLRGQVHHRPYSLREATVEIREESILAAAGLTRSGSPAHVCFSPGVDVEIFPLGRVEK
jgi:uncharacterized protein YqjF (DUF2071 family)